MSVGTEVEPNVMELRAMLAGARERNEQLTAQLAERDARLDKCAGAYRDMRRERDELRAQVSDLTHELDRTVSILRRPNQKLSAQERIDSALSPFLYRRLAGGDDYTPLPAERTLREGDALPMMEYHRWDFAAVDGTNDQAVSGTLQGCEAARAIHRDSHDDFVLTRLEDGRQRRQPVTTTLFAPTYTLLKHPSQIGRSDEAMRNHGGKREPRFCPECHGLNLREERRTHVRVVCEDCARVVEEWDEEPQVRMINAEIEAVNAHPAPIPEPNPVPANPEKMPESQVDTPEIVAPTLPVPMPSAALTPAWVEGEDWYDPTAPDDALSQLLTWALYEDVAQATVWYKAERIRGAFQRNTSVLTVQKRGALRPVDFALYLRELYTGGDYKQLREIAKHRGADPDAIRPLLESLGEPESDDPEPEGNDAA